tara:strand:- start:70 stop:1413 length:1344 start_codon:yes stop_codon:yes gene_type:complete
MSTLPKRVAETPFDYVLEKAIITSDSFGTPGAFIDIKNVVTDIEIFEHLDKPYLTAALAFVDDRNIYNAANFSGAERLTLRLKLPGPDSFPSEKVFVIDKVIKNIKNNDSTSVIVLHLIEEHAFVSNLINVNKAYTGKPTDIIQNIIKDTLGLEFSGTVSPDDQPNMRVIIPNLTALAAAQWVRDRATSLEGTPYYLFSTFANSKIHLVDLAEMLRAPVDPTEYWYSQLVSATGTDSPVDEQAYLIQNYFVKNSDEILSLVKKGLVGANYFFYDPMTGLPTKVGFDIDSVFENLKDKDIIQQNQNNMSYNPYHVHNNTPLHKLVSRQITKIITTNTYSDAANYTESSNSAMHKQKIISEALRSFLVKDSIDVVLPGRNFLIGNYSNTIGNQIRLRFLNNSVDTGDTDTKKSGDYLIYALKHVFKKERYDVMVSGVKLADLPEKSKLE